MKNAHDPNETSFLEGGNWTLNLQGKVLSHYARRCFRTAVKCVLNVFNNVLNVFDSFIFFCFEKIWLILTKIKWKNSNSSKVL